MSGVVKHDEICVVNLLLYSCFVRVSIDKGVGEAFHLLSSTVVINDMNDVRESALDNVSKSLRNGICQNKHDT
jgi:hypothetical protein